MTSPLGDPECVRQDPDVVIVGKIRRNHRDGNDFADRPPRLAHYPHDDPLARIIHLNCEIKPYP